MGKTNNKSVRLVLATMSSTKKAREQSTIVLYAKRQNSQLLSYEKFMSHIKQVEIRKVYSVEEEFSNDIQ